MKRPTKAQKEYIKNNFMLLNAETITEQFVLRQLQDLVDFLDEFIDDSKGNLKAEFQEQKDTVLETMNLYRLKREMENA